jgi:hypothetical protein
MSGGLYSIDVDYACAGIIVRDGTVIRAAPIFHWMRGKPLTEIIAWVESKHGKLEKI